jgi:hypothetical protein
MSNFAHCPTPDNDDEEEEVQEDVQEETEAPEDPFLGLTGTEEYYATSQDINVSTCSRA